MGNPINPIPHLDRSGATMSSTKFILYPSMRFIFIPGIELCRDGYLGINTLTTPQWADILGMMALDDWY